MNFVLLDGKKYFPSKVICVGKNYSAHIKEMGGKDVPKEPTIFLKPNSSIVCGEKSVFIPDSYGLLHHEVELCFIAGKRIKDAGFGDAVSAIEGFAVGIDFTLRSVQYAAKKDGGPWSIAKGFDSAAVFGEFVSIEAASVFKARIQLKVGGAIRQDANTEQMIFSPSQILSYVSRFMTVEEGDVFMCGTPEGVGSVMDVDEISAEIEGLPPVKFKVIRSGGRSS